MSDDARGVTVALTPTRFGLLQVPVTIDGHEVSLLVDTGASATVLDRARAEQRGIVGDPSDLSAIGCVTENGLTKLDAQGLSVGPMRFGPVRVPLVDLSHVNAQFTKAGEAAVDGVLGIDVLARGAAVISLSPPELRMRRDG